jgi:hypothetical protein
LNRSLNDIEAVKGMKYEYFNPNEATDSCD